MDKSLLQEFASLPDESNTLLEESIKVGMTKNPDQFAGHLKQSRKHGIPVSMVENAPDRVATIDKMSQIDPIRLKHASPGLVKFLSNPQNSSAMHDQITALEEIERILGTPKQSGGSLFKGLGTTIPESFKKGVTSTKLWFNQEATKTSDADVHHYINPETATKLGLSQDRLAGMSARIRKRNELMIPERIKQLQEHEKIIQDNTPKNLSLTQQGIRGGVESLAHMAPLIGATILSRSGVPMIAGMGYQVGAESYAKGIEGGLNHEEATHYAAIDAAIEAGTEYGPAKLMSGMFQNMGKKKFGNFIKKWMATEFLGEQLATAGQTTNAYLHNLDKELNDPNKSFAEKAKIQAERQYITAVATVVAGGTQTGVIGAIDYGMRDKEKIDDIENKAVEKELQTQSEQDRLDQITSLSQGMRDRDPELAQQYFQTVMKEHELEEQVYISSDTLQEALTEGDYSLDDTAIESINEMARIAGETGQDVAIPLAEYMTYFADDTTIRDNVRLTTDGLSLVELREAPKVRENIVSRMVEEAELNVEKKDEADRIWSEVTEQLKATGKMNSRVARTQASIIPAYVVTKSERTGKSIEQVYADLGVTIESGDTQGVSLEQAQSEGYEGQDTGEAQEWLNAKAKGLDMSQEGRMQRAKEMNADLDNDYYHGTAVDVASYDPAKAGGVTGAKSAKLGTWLSNSPTTAEGYANLATDKPVNDLIKEQQQAERQGNWDLADELTRKAEELDAQDRSGQNIQKVVVLGKIKKLDMDGVQYDPDDVNLSELAEEAKAEGFDALTLENFSDEAGYGNYNPVNHTIVFDPKNIRSTNAAFDPDHSDSANLLAQSEIAESGGVSLKEFNNYSHKELSSFFDGFEVSNIPSPESFSNSTSGDIKLVSDFLTSDTIIKETDSSIDTERSLEMMEAVFRIAHDLKVTDSIIGLIPVSVVNNLSSQKLTPDMFFHEKSVLKDFLSSSPPMSVPVVNETLTAFAEASAFVVAKEISTFSKLRLNSLDSSSTSSTASGSSTVSSDSLASANIGTEELSRFILFDDRGGFVGGGVTDTAINYSQNNISSNKSRSSLQSSLKTGNRGSIELLPNNKRIIRLNESADFSTFLHEASHLFLEVEKSYALNSGVTDDQQAILDFIGLKSFDELNSKTKEGVIAHEKFASAFENYLMEGKAPSAALYDSFRTFKRWLTQLYKTITAYPEVQLNKEIRDVFDRMLATDTEIKAVQSEYGPVDVAENSTERASEDLLSKVLKQLRIKTEKWWKEEFNEEYSDALAELEESQVYKAENYLRENKVDTRQAGEVMGYIEPKRSKSLDPKKDSLVEAIGKMGGIDRSEAEAQGIDPAIWEGKRNVNKSYMYGGMPFRKSAGDSFDGMARRLADEGYLNGLEAHNPNSLLEAVEDELNGFESYSNQYEPDINDGLEMTTKPRRLYGTTKKDGLDIDFAAQQNGYVSGDMMLSAIADSQEIKIAAKELANQNMIEKYGDILNDGTLEEEAKHAVNNEDKAKKLLAELKAVNPNNKTPSGINRDMLKKAAIEAIGNMPIRQLSKSVEGYHRKEVKAAQEFERLKSEGDLELAEQAKMDQLLNFYLFREARNMRDKTERWREYAQGVKTRKYSASQVHPDYINHMRKYSSAFDFRKKPRPQTIEELKSLANWINSQNETNPEGYAPQFYDPVLARLADPDTNIEDIKLNNWQDMTVNNLQSVKEQLEHLRFVGGKLSENEKAKRQAIVEELADSIIKLGGKSKAKVRHARKKSIKDRIAGFGYSQLRAYANVEEMDGYRDDPANGAMFKHIWQQILDASDVNVELKLEMAEKIKFILNPDKATRDRLADKTLKTFKTMSGDISFTPMERVMFAVYWGSPESRATLMETGAEGKPLTITEAQQILDSLTDTDIKVVNGIWEMNESLKSQMFATERKVNGIAPKAVDKASFTIRGQFLPGGYQKIKYERSSIDDVGRQDPMTEAMNQIMGSGISTTKAGSMNERVGAGGRELSLKLSNVTSALDESIQFISFAEVSRDVSRIMRNPEVKDAIEDKYGKARLDSLVDALNSAFVGDVANGHGADNIADWARAARSNMSMAMLMFSVRNIVQQVVGSTNVLSKTGIVDYTKASADFMGNTAHWVDFVESRSPMMKNRMKLTNREVTETANSLDASATNGWLKNHGYVVQTSIDKAIGMPGWLSAYRKGMEIYATSSNPDKRASQYADEIVVSTLGSGQIKDLAPMFSGASQKGNPLATEFLKQLTFMGSFFNIVGGLYYRSYKTNDLKTVKGFANFQKDLFWTLYLPAIASALIVDDIPDDEPWAEWAAKKITGYGFGSMMGIRDIVGYFNEGFAPSLPVSNALKAAGSMLNNGHGLVTGEKEADSRMLANTIRDVSPFLGLPGAYQAARIIKGVEDDEQDIYGTLVEGKERNK